MITEDVNCVRVYVVQHVAREDTLDEDVKFIGVYSSREKAERVVEKFKVKQGFSDFPDGFCIDAYRIDQDHWAEGFITVQSCKARARARKRYQK